MVPFVKLVPTFIHIIPLTIKFVLFLTPNNTFLLSSGGAFGTREKAQEDQYFRKQQQQQLKELKGHLDEEVKHHEDEIKRHQERIKQLSEKAKKLDK